MDFRFLSIGLLAVCLAVGCGKDEEQPKEPGPLVGNWLLKITQHDPEENFLDKTTVLLQIRQDDEGNYAAELKGNTSALPRAGLKAYELSDENVHLVLTSDDFTLDFLGRLQDGVIRGNLDFGGLNLDAAQLVRTDLTDIATAQIVTPPLGLGEFTKAITSAEAQGKSQYAAALEFCNKNPKSPISIRVYRDLVQDLSEQALSESKIQDFARNYLKAAAHWGERMETLSRFQLGWSLCRYEDYADLGLKYLKEAESGMSGDKKRDLAASFENARRLAGTANARQTARKARALVKDGKTEEGLAALRTLHQDFSFDPVIKYLFAEAARTTNQPEDALRLYAQLSTWPNVESTLTTQKVFQDGDRVLPQQRLAELWTAQRGGEAGLEEFKNEIYEECVTTLAEQLGPASPASTGNRVNVVELFTGTQCPPCVGADLATDALERLYPRSNLVVLRYHLHVPGADPLTTAENYERFQTLLGPQGAMSTPSMFVNGIQPAHEVGGFLDNAAQIAGSLQKTLAPTLDDTTPLSLKLAARQLNGEIIVDAELPGVPESQKENLRVLLLLAEGDIAFDAPNGIRRHEMVVRWFYNGGNGSELASDGSFQYATRTRREEISKRLHESLQEAEKTLKFTFETIPMDLKDLHFVGLVLDAQSHEVLQAAVVPVSAKSLFPELPDPPTLPLPSPEKTAPESGPLLMPPTSKPPAKPAQAEKSETTEAVLPQLPN